jgi:hypothetical protein
VIASNNSLLGLDIHEMPPYDVPKPKNHVSSSDKDKRRQKVADTVVKALSPYYKGKKVASKVLPGYLSQTEQ